MAFAGLGFLTQSIWILAIALGLMGTQSAFFAPTKNAVMPQWLDSDELIRGNALLSGTQFAVILIGTIIGIQLGTSQPLILAGLIFALSLVGWIAAETCPPAVAPNPDLKVDYNPLTAIASVLSLIFKHPDVLRPWLLDNLDLHRIHGDDGHWPLENLGTGSHTPCHNWYIGRHAQFASSLFCAYTAIYGRGEFWPCR